MLSRQGGATPMILSIPARFAFIVAAITLILSGVAITAQQNVEVENFVPVTDAMLQNPDPSDWLNWRRTLDGQAHSPLDQITTENVDQLRLTWSWGMYAGNQQTTPIVHDGIMFLANVGPWKVT